MYRVGELARAALVNPRTIDFYTRQGLLTPEAQTEGKHRLYSEASLQRLRLIHELQAKGYSLNEIRSTMEQQQGEVLTEVARLETDLENLGRMVANLHGQPLDGRTRELLQHLAVKGMVIAQSLLLLLGESGAP